VPLRGRHQFGRAIDESRLLVLAISAFGKSFDNPSTDERDRM
jgi:hypothetical protein